MGKQISCTAVRKKLKKRFFACSICVVMPVYVCVHEEGGEEGKRRERERQERVE